MEYHSMRIKDSNASGGRQTISLMGLRLWPEVSAHDQNPDVVFWLREAYQRTLAAQPKGETDANATAIATKNKARHPQKSTDIDSLGVQGETHKHVYLERADGTLISLSELRALSQKAHSLWQSLHSLGATPRTWGKITSIAWEYYAQSMLNEPGLEFLRLCDDSQWKLKEWTQTSYSPWAKRNGIREARPKKEPGEDDSLNNEDLIQMEPIDEEVPGDVNSEEGAEPHIVDNAQNDEYTLVQTAARAKSVMVNPL